MSSPLSDYDAAVMITRAAADGYTSLMRDVVQTVTDTSDDDLERKRLLAASMLCLSQCFVEGHARMAAGVSINLSEPIPAHLMDLVLQKFRLATAMIGQVGPRGNPSSPVPS